MYLQWYFMYYAVNSVLELFRIFCIMLLEYDRYFAFFNFLKKTKHQNRYDLNLFILPSAIFSGQTSIIRM